MKIIFKISQLLLIITLLLSCNRNKNNEIEQASVSENNYYYDLTDEEVENLIKPLPFDQSKKFFTC